MVLTCESLFYTEYLTLRWDLHDDFFVSRARCLPFIEDAFFPNMSSSQSCAWCVRIVSKKKTDSPQENNLNLYSIFIAEHRKQMETPLPANHCLFRI